MAVWVTVRAGAELADFHANLRAPILVAEGKGHQVINEAADAPVRAPLFPAAVRPPRSDRRSARVHPSLRS